MEFAGYATVTNKWSKKITTKEKKNVEPQQHG